MRLGRKAVVMVVALALVGWLVAMGTGSGRSDVKAVLTASTRATITQPTPPITSAAFPEEPEGTAPADGDGLIPNPATPTGSPVGPPSSCTETFSSAAGATSATVNAWIAANENDLTATTVVCLAGTFTDPIHVWSKSSTALLEIAPEPGQTATLDLGEVVPADVNPNQYWSDSGGMSIVDSRSVEVYGLTIENFTYDGPALDPAGIYVTARSDTTNTNQTKVPHLSACYLDGGSCSDIYLIDNTVTAITNTADEVDNSKSLCNNAEVAAYGIAIISGGSSTTKALQHVVLEGNNVSATRTGESETVTINGDIEDFLAYDNTIHDTDNIGLDTIGWEAGQSQARHGLVADNTVYDVDTYSNASYGKWTGTSCQPLAENAAGLYDDGGAYVWWNGNTVWNTDQGIDLDVETAHRYTDNLLVSDNTIHDDPGTALGDPSTGTEPPGVSGASRVAGHDYVALYVDAFGTGSSIRDVYIHDNTIQNESQYFLDRSGGSPAVDLGGKWSTVQIWHNTIEGMGPTDTYNALFEVDQQPSSGSSVVVNCNDYQDLSTSSKTVNGNFALPSNDWLTLAQWQAHNGHGWDADSAVGAFDSACPTQSTT